MSKRILIALLAAIVVAAPAFADDTPQGVASDVGAVQKDNQALVQKKAKLAKDRAAKAQDKATGNMGGQAVDSMKVGVDKMGTSEKETEQSTDKKVLNNDVNSSVNQ